MRNIQKTDSEIVILKIIRIKLWRRLYPWNSTLRTMRLLLWSHSLDVMKILTWSQKTTSKVGLGTPKSSSVKRNKDRYGISDLWNVGDRCGNFCSDSMDVRKSTKRDFYSTIPVTPPDSPFRATPSPTPKETASHHFIPCHKIDETWLFYNNAGDPPWFAL